MTTLSLRNKGPRFIDLTGRRFGRVVVDGPADIVHNPNGQPAQRWQCSCDCGARLVTRGIALRHGHTRSCGCLQKEKAGATRRTHGRSRTPEYRALCAMIERCENPTGPNTHLYYARGITVCDRWRHDFNAFLADMGPRPSPRHSVDRINVNGHYEPGNCRWALPVVQANNSRRNVYLTHDGETMSVAQWADRKGIRRSTAYARVARGWSVDRVLAA